MDDKYWLRRWRSTNGISIFKHYMNAKAKQLNDGEYWVNRWLFMNCKRQYLDGRCTGSDQCKQCMYRLSMGMFLRMAKDTGTV